MPDLWSTLEHFGQTTVLVRQTQVQNPILGKQKELERGSLASQKSALMIQLSELKHGRSSLVWMLTPTSCELWNAELQYYMNVITLNQFSQGQIQWGVEHHQLLSIIRTPVLAQVSFE